MTTGAVSPRRADTRRNHERILAVAARALAHSGDLSYNAVAKQAGVGVGTVYRHFPTPESLIFAVYEREVRNLVEIVPTLLQDYPPDQAFRVWTVDHFARYMMTKRGLVDALRVATSACGELPAGPREALAEAITTLLKANVEAGNVRADLDAETVMRGLSGLMTLDPNGDWRGQTERHLDLLWWGMHSPGRRDQ